MHGVSANAIDLVDNCILYPWVMRQGLRHQGVLLGAIRGCDSVDKEDPSKLLIRCYRNEVLRCHCGDPAKSSSFIEQVDLDELGKRMVSVLKSTDHYPLHFVLHLMFAAEIVGYKKPSEQWLWFYNKLCKHLHVNPETEEQLDSRLSLDEQSFAKAAKI